VSTKNVPGFSVEQADGGTGDNGCMKKTNHEKRKKVSVQGHTPPDPGKKIGGHRKKMKGLGWCNLANWLSRVGAGRVNCGYSMGKEERRKRGGLGKVPDREAKARGGRLCIPSCKNGFRSRKARKRMSTGDPRPGAATGDPFKGEGGSKQGC